MSFAADLKDFASSFRDTYKVLHESGRDELAREQAAHLRDDRGAKVRGEAAFQSGRNIGGLNTPDARSSDTGSASERKAPVFTTVKFDNTAPRLINDLVNEVGLPEHAAQGFVGRLGAETGGFSTLQETNPTVRNSRGGFGYAQWTGPRRDAFEAYAAAKGLDPASYEANKGFLVHELTNTREGRVLDALKRTRNAQEAGNVVERQFLRPGIPHGRRGVSWVDRAGKFGLGQGGSDLVEQAKRLGPLPRRAAIDTEDDETAPVVYAATGGVIPSGSDRAVDTTISENAGSNPVTRDVMDAEASEADLGPDDYDPAALVDIDGARRAVEGGLRFGQRMLGLEAHHAAVPGAVQPDGNALKALAHSVGAATPEDKQVIRKTIDPQGKLSPELAEIASYNALYKYYKSRGDDGKADRAAWGMLTAAKQAATQYGAAALAQSDPRKRAEIIAKGYNQLVPDGNTMKITGSGKDGVKFEVVDPKGNLTEKGAMAVDDIMQLATGMVDGTQWLQSALGFATSAPTNAEKALEKRASARAAFEASIAGKDDQDYVSTLSDEDRKLYLAMDPRERKEFAQRHERRAQEEAKAQRFDERNELQAERDAIKAGERKDAVADRWARFDINRDDRAMATARKEEIQAFDMARKQGNWEAMRSDRLSLAERWQALKERDLNDRNARQDQSQAARQKRYEEIDKRIIESRGTKNSPMKLSMKEAVEDRRLGAINTAEGQARMAIAGEGQEGNEFGYGGGPSPQQETRMGAVSAEAGFNRIPEANRKFDDADYGLIRTGVEKLFPDPTKHNVERLWGSRIASDIRRSGDFSNDDAVMLLQHALDPKSPEPRVNPRDGTVSFGPNLPPVKMTADSVMALAQLRGRATKVTPEPKPTVRQAIPGATAPVRTAPEEDLRARAANRRRAIETWGAPAR